MVRSPSWSRRTFVFATLATLGAFGVLVAALTLRLRSQLRVEVLQREAEGIHAVALMELNAVQSHTPELATADPMSALFAAVLESSRLRGVVAVQLFDAHGQLQMALPDTGGEGGGAPWWAPDLARPAVQFRPAASLEKILGAEVEAGAKPTRVPLLEIVVPLHLGPQGSMVGGSARYWTDGTSVAAEFTRMDRRLAIQASLAYGGTALLVGALLAWTFSRLAESHRRLEEQRADLARANQQLDFAAKTGAIGAITAHLIHGLNNPLAGLEGFVADPSFVRDGEQGEAWQSAIDTTRRLRALVREIMAVLRDESEGRADYPVPLGELLSAVQQRARDAAAQAGVTLEVATSAEGVLLARTANLAGLILANLISNAIEASPRGAAVKVTTQTNARGLEILVQDSGRGLPAGVRATLFQAVKSTKRNGGGVGLAISRQLALHAAGDLELIRSDAAGTVFCLRLPWLEPPPPVA